MAQEHTFASPGPAGLAALAVACFGFGAVFNGWVKVEGLPILFAWLVGGGVVQYTTAVMELKDHNITGGNVFLFFSAFFMFGASLSVLAKFLMIKFGMAPHAYVEGWTWMAGAGFLTAVTQGRNRHLRDDSGDSQLSPSINRQDSDDIQGATCRRAGSPARLVLSRTQLG